MSVKRRAAVEVDVGMDDVPRAVDLLWTAREMSVCTMAGTGRSWQLKWMTSHKEFTADSITIGATWSFAYRGGVSFTSARRRRA